MRAVIDRGPEPVEAGVIERFEPLGAGLVPPDPGVDARLGRAGEQVAQRLDLGVAFLGRRRVVDRPAARIGVPVCDPDFPGVERRVEDLGDARARRSELRLGRGRRDGLAQELPFLGDRIERQLDVVEAERLGEEGLVDLDGNPGRAERDLDVHPGQRRGLDLLQSRDVALVAPVGN